MKATIRLFIAVLVLFAANAVLADAPKNFPVRTTPTIYDYLYNMGPAGSYGDYKFQIAQLIALTSERIWQGNEAPPSDTTGIDGDTYLNTTTGAIYLKAGGTWSGPVVTFALSDHAHAGLIDSVGSCTEGDCAAADLLADLIALGAWDLSSLSLTFGPWRFLNSNWSPALVGQFGYDNTVAGMTGGAMVYFSSEIRYLLDVAALPDESGQVPIYDAVTGKWVPGFGTRYYNQVFDPQGVCAGAFDGLALVTADDNNGHDLVVERWRLQFIDADPTTEADVDLMRADSHPGRANAAVMDVMDTTAGVAAESTPANINGGAAVANGKVIYLRFGTAYTEANHQVQFEMWYHFE